MAWKVYHCDRPMMCLENPLKTWVNNGFHHTVRMFAQRLSAMSRSRDGSSWVNNRSEYETRRIESASPDELPGPRIELILDRRHSSSNTSPAVHTNLAQVCTRSNTVRCFGMCRFVLLLSIILRRWSVFAAYPACSSRSSTFGSHSVQICG
jgi:hypothetical protein